MESIDKEKLIEIVKNAENMPNKDLLDAQKLFFEEFDKTKILIINLTRHLETIEEYYNTINNEIKKRLG